MVLATYNGDRYLSALLESLALQTVPAHRILVGDDSSQDNTLAILEHAQKQGLPIEIVESTNCRLGVTENFARLLSRCNGDYIFLADQDDIWHTKKIEILVTKLKTMESRDSGKVPAMVYSDARVVDTEGRLMAKSAAAYQRFRMNSGIRFSRMLLQNTVMGCTMAFNRELLDSVLPIPREAVMHDWWLLLTANAIGRVAFVDGALINYRQHMNNHVGATHCNYIALFYNFMSITSAVRLRQIERLDGALRQAEIFHDRYASVLTQGHRAELEAFLSLANLKGWVRKRTAIRWRFHKEGLLRTLAFYSIL